MNAQAETQQGETLWPERNIKGYLGALNLFSLAYLSSSVRTHPGTSNSKPLAQ